MGKRKIINDPIHGLISFEFDLIYDLINHSYFQRLRRIGQTGLSHYVYPGSTHTRFAHAIGATHLMTTAIKVLRSKGVNISDTEYLSACIAILLHDIGHGPFSHTLEHSIIHQSHEELTLEIMNLLNTEFDGQLDKAIQIFQNQYPRGFLHQLVSSQMDMDRMDYLARDSYFSGVAEGITGYKRIITMLNIKDDTLVVEDKGIYSVLKFLVARQIMYWQVYLHKTSLGAEIMLQNFMKRLNSLVQKDKLWLNVIHSEALVRLLDQESSNNNQLENLLQIDDSDIFTLLKNSHLKKDPILKFLSEGIINRVLFKLDFTDDKIKSDPLKITRLKVCEKYGIHIDMIDNLVVSGEVSSVAYFPNENPIKILDKSGNIQDITNYLENLVKIEPIVRHFLCYPEINS